jgi:selenocysteine lyase/cysteine desulfurase
MPELHSVYLNHAGTSWPKPLPVLQATTETDQAAPDVWPMMFDNCQRTVADFFQVPHNRLLFTPSCTAALSVGLTDLPWQPGDRLLTSPFEHHALFRNVQKLAEQGVDVTILEAGDQQLIDLDGLKAQLRQGGVRLLALTAACNVTGQLLPLVQATELAKQFGAMVLIDGAQLAGWEMLNLTQLGIDLFTFAGHKGLMAPKGIGGLYVAQHVRMNCMSASCDPGSAGAQEWMPDYCDVGSVNYAALNGLAAGCRWLSDPAQADRLSRARKLASAFADGVRELPNAVLHHDVAAELKMPTVAFNIAGCATSRLAEEFQKERIFVSFGFQCATQVHHLLKTDLTGVIRCSFGHENTAADVDTALECLRNAVNRRDD